MRFREYLLIVLISSGLSFLMFAGAQFYFNNFEFIDSPFQETFAKPSVSQETSEVGGQEFPGEDEIIYTLRDKLEGIGLYYSKDEGQITYFVYNNTESPVCVYAEIIAQEDIDSAVFFTIPLYPDTDRILGIIRLIPEKKAFYVFNWHTTKNSQKCMGDINA